LALNGPTFSSAILFRQSSTPKNGDVYLVDTATYPSALQAIR